MHFNGVNKYLTPSQNMTVLGGKTLVSNHRGQPFLVVGHQVCTHLRRDFVNHRQHSSSSSKHGKFSWCQRAIFWSHLTTTLSPSSPLNHWQTSDGPVHVLSWARGPCRRCRISVLHGVVLPIIFLVTMVSAGLRSLTRSSHVVLGSWSLKPH